MSVVVCNSSPLIALNRIGRIDLLQLAFTSLVVPSAVVRETSWTVMLPPWIIETPLSRPVDPRIAAAGLGAGETEAIALAMELGASRVILDDRDARSLAESVGQNVIGTVGIIAAAKRNGHLSAIRPLLDQLRTVRFYIGKNVYEHALIAAGELP